MKPLAITIQAFGSYVFQTIDFTKLTQNLFLVTGDTGAGKSTIFDAIVFALYGGTGSETNKKAYEDMWSQYAEDGQKPFVELTFSEKNGGNDEIYKVKRSLSCSSANKFSQKVTLIKLPEDKDFKGTVSEINDIIEEIIGLSKSQFMQVAMIAQGEFMELIRIDDSKDKNKKKAIFRKLFRTDIYEKIISELKKRKDIKDGEVGEIRAECRSLVTRAESGDNEKIKELQKRIISEKIPSYSDIADFKTRLEIFNSDVGKNFESAKKTAEKSRADYEKAHDTLVRAVETKGNFDKLAQAEKVLSELKKSEGDIKNSEELMKKIISAYEIKAVYDRYSATEKSLSETEKKLEKLTENMPFLEKSLAISKSAEEKAGRESEYARDIYNKVSETAEFYRDVVIQRKNVETAIKSYETARKKHDMKNSEYNAKYRDFLDAQAGFMARELKNGEPCPVCGSTEHPRPCMLEINSNITREVIDRLKSEADNLRKLQEEKSAEARSAVDRLADMEKKTAYKSEKEAENALDSARNDMNAREAVYRKAVQETRKAEKYRTETAVLVKKYTEEVPELRKECQFWQKEYHGIVAEKVLDGWQEVTGSYERKYAEELRKKTDRYNREKYNAEGGFEQAKKAVEGKEIPDIAELEKIEKNTGEVFANAREELKKLENIFLCNSNLFPLLAEQAEKLGTLVSESEMLNSLYLRLNGGQKGNKLSLETFVQRKYLEMILDSANAHFLEMSAGQFELRLKNSEEASDGRRDYGLDLMVYSAVTDTEREVKTLSGGESFMGALSLALGMAEQIQQTSSAVNLDMMFIDEGFGSLDEYSRRQAVNVLKEMAEGERLIGIISHVTEMKTEIENQLVVTRDENGSRADWHIS